MQIFLEDYYDLLDPEGVKECKYQNKLIEERLVNVEVNFLGHTLVHDAALYQSLLEGAPEDLRGDLLDLIRCRPDMAPPSAAQSRHRYEEMYYRHTEEAFLWQEYVADEVLLRILKLLWRSGIRTEYFDLNT